VGREREEERRRGMEKEMERELRQYQPHDIQR
jgi:hypothetical protein